MDETKSMNDMLKFAMTEDQLTHAIVESLYIAKKYSMLVILFTVGSIFLVPVMSTISLSAMIWTAFIFILATIIFMSAIIIQYIAIGSYKTRLFILRTRNKR